MFYILCMFFSLSVCHSSPSPFYFWQFASHPLIRIYNNKSSFGYFSVFRIPFLREYEYFALIYTRFFVHWHLFILFFSCLYYFMRASLVLNSSLNADAISQPKQWRRERGRWIENRHQARTEMNYSGAVTVPPRVIRSLTSLALPFVFVKWPMMRADEWWAASKANKPKRIAYFFVLFFFSNYIYPDSFYLSISLPLSPRLVSSPQWNRAVIWRGKNLNALLHLHILSRCRLFIFFHSLVFFIFYVCF